MKQQKQQPKPAKPKAPANIDDRGRTVYPGAIVVFDGPTTGVVEIVHNGAAIIQQLYQTPDEVIESGESIAMQCSEVTVISRADATDIASLGMSDIGARCLRLYMQQKAWLDEVGGLEKHFVAKDESWIRTALTDEVVKPTSEALGEFWNNVMRCVELRP